MRTSLIRPIYITAIMLSSVMTANADDKDGEREALECMPAKGIIKVLSKFNDFKPEKRDTVDAVVDAKFIVKDGGELPDRFFFRSGDEEADFKISETGAVEGFSSVSRMDSSGEICVEDPTRAGQPEDAEGLGLDVDFEVKFIDTAGPYSMAALRDGAKDGKSFYKKLVPAPIRLMIPKMTHVSVTFDEPKDGQIISAIAGGQVIEGLIIEPFGDTFVIELDHLEAIGAEQLSITGGSFILEPSPSIKKMKKLGFSEEDEDAGDAEKE